MKRQSLQKKRIATGEGGLFIFHSKVSRRKRQRVAASADLASEVPNLGVARALFVILILHVAAIAAIFIHNRVTADDVVVTPEGSKKEAASAGRPAASPKPVVKSGETFYFVSTGDTYDRIARLKSVDVQELRDLNESKGLDPGAILRIPVSTTANPEVVPARISGPDASSTARVAGSNDGVALEVSDVSQGKAGPASSAQENVSVLAGAEVSVPRAIPVPEDNAPFRTYAVKSGDTAWKIARLFKIPVETLLEANKIADARKLQVNMKLRIPSR
jgi:LysM repeat protein